MLCTCKGRGWEGRGRKGSLGGGRSQMFTCIGIVANTIAVPYLNKSDCKCIVLLLQRNYIRLNVSENQNCLSLN